MMRTSAKEYERRARAMAIGLSLVDQKRYETAGYALAMRVMQSDLYCQLDNRERAECDELIRRGMA